MIKMFNRCPALIITSGMSSQLDRQAEPGWSEATDQLLQVVLDPWQVGKRADGHQAAESKVKQLVAEERDEPAVAMLKEKREKSQFHLSRSSQTTRNV